MRWIPATRAASITTKVARADGALLEAPEDARRGERRDLVEHERPEDAPVRVQPAARWEPGLPVLRKDLQEDDDGLAVDAREEGHGLPGHPVDAREAEPLDAGPELAELDALAELLLERRRELLVALADPVGLEVRGDSPRVELRAQLGVAGETILERRFRGALEKTVEIQIEDLVRLAHRVTSSFGAFARTRRR